MDGVKEILKKLDKFKYPLLVLAIGLGILLIPGSAPEKSIAGAEEAALTSVLAKTEGVGEVQVILSEKGAVIVCAGADDAGTRLDIVTAVSTYTGFGSDRITILKLRT